MIYQPPLDTSVSVSDTAMFNCSVSGQSTLEVEWFRQLPNGTLDPISSGGSYSIQNNIFSMNPTSSLSISLVTLMDGGKYVCRANSGGVTYSSSTAVLTVLGKITLVLLMIFLCYRLPYVNRRKCLYLSSHCNTSRE